MHVQPIIKITPHCRLVNFDTVYFCRWTLAFGANKTFRLQDIKDIGSSVRNISYETEKHKTYHSRRPESFTAVKSY